MMKVGTCLRLSPLLLLNRGYKTRNPVSVGFHGNSILSNKWRKRSGVDRIFSSGSREDNGCISSDSSVFLPEKEESDEELEPLWDDGYGSQTLRDYIEAAKDMFKSDGGPPRWFCPVEAGPPLKNSPLLLYLPGMDGLGMGMVLHQKALGKVFEVRCMHIPLSDRTPFEELVKFVEDAVRAEHALFPDKPIYVVGDSFGGCLALSLAASNPTIDLVLILVNPATSFDRSQLQSLIPYLEAIPEELYNMLRSLFVTTLGNPIKMAKVNSSKRMYISPATLIEKRILELSDLMIGASNYVHVFPKPTLIWKLKLLKSGAAFTNSRLHAVKCEALILASGNDFILPSTSEAERLSNLLKDSRVRVFKDNGHTLLLEDEINLLTVLKGTCMYRHSRTRDAVTDFLPPSRSEFQYVFDQHSGFFRVATSPVFLSTLADGKIVRGLEGVPDQGPVLLVGYHMLLGTEIISIADQFLREKNLMVHGLAHPQIFNKDFENAIQDPRGFDYMKVFGAIPVTPRNLLRLLSRKSHVLLYPGGVREALHRKGESYRLFWPEEPEFVRMATRHGATVVPFGAVGGDDMFELFLDYDDLMRIPPAREMILHQNEKADRVRVRSEMKGEVSNQDFFVPGFYPKLPGRFYFLFGKPMKTAGREEELGDRVGAREFYLQIKSEVERCMSYLIEKREEDPFRGLFDRLWHRVVSAPVHEIPTFDP